MKRYIYEGKVKIFGTCVNPHWYAETVAASKKKAKSNFKYQYKQTHNLTVSVKIDLPDDVIEDEEEVY